MSLNKATFNIKFKISAHMCCSCIWQRRHQQRPVNVAHTE